MEPGAGRFWVPTKQTPEAPGGVRGQAGQLRASPGQFLTIQSNGRRAYRARRSEVPHLTTDFPDRLLLQLADAFARQVIFVADLFQRELVFIV
jgi:hypothetical protein